MVSILDGQDKSVVPILALHCWGQNLRIPSHEGVIIEVQPVIRF